MSEDSIESGFARTYGFELLFSETPKINIHDTLIELEEQLGKIEHKEGSEQHIFFMSEHLAQYSDDKKLPSQLILVHADASKDNDSLIEEIQQSWQTPNASEIVEKTKYKVLLTDLMSSGLDIKERHEILSNALKSFVKNSNCIGVACKRTQQVLDSNAVITNTDPLFGFINIRFFNAGEDGLVMDSVGLSALGLFDVQCHFTQLDPNEVSHHLYNVTYYIFDQEPFFENGQTIDGLNNNKWTVQFEVSLVGPEREVLDLNPGSMFSAANR